MRRFAVLMLVSVLVFGVTHGALATEPGSEPDLVDGHKITICHATNAEPKPYVVITIDVAAWNSSGEEGHSPEHHVNAKTGAADRVWSEVTGCEDEGGPGDT